MSGTLRKWWWLEKVDDDCDCVLRTMMMTTAAANQIEHQHRDWRRPNERDVIVADCPCRSSGQQSCGGGEWNVGACGGGDGGGWSHTSRSQLVCSTLKDILNWINKLTIDEVVRKESKTRRDETMQNIEIERWRLETGWKKKTTLKKKKTLKKSAETMMKRRRAKQERRTTKWRANESKTASRKCGAANGGHTARTNRRRRSIRFLGEPNREPREGRNHRHHQQHIFSSFSTASSCWCFVKMKEINDRGSDTWNGWGWKRWQKQQCACACRPVGRCTNVCNYSFSFPSFFLSFSYFFCFSMVRLVVCVGCRRHGNVPEKK